MAQSTATPPATASESAPASDPFARLRQQAQGVQSLPAC